MENYSVKCNNCERTIEQIDQPCPQCAPQSRVFTIQVQDSTALSEKLRMTGRDSGVTGRRKIFIEQIIRDELFRKTGNQVEKIRVIDRRNDKYLEKVTDPSTGEVIHYTEEPLSSHTGHGKARE